jgi:hypothetical protein
MIRTWFLCLLHYNAQRCSGVDMACYVLLGTEQRRTVAEMTLLTLSEILVIQAVRLGQARGPSASALRYIAIQNHL